MASGMIDRSEGITADLIGRSKNATLEGIAALFSRVYRQKPAGVLHLGSSEKRRVCGKIR